MVTLPTELPRGRYVAALLRRVGAQECIARTPEEYVERAVALGCDPALRAELGTRIRAHAPLVFETRAAVDQLERFFAEALTAV